MLSNEVASGTLQAFDSITGPDEVDQFNRNSPYIESLLSLRQVQTQAHS